MTVTVELIAAASSPEGAAIVLGPEFQAVTSGAAVRLLDARGAGVGTRAFIEGHMDGVTPVVAVVDDSRFLVAAKAAGATDVVLSTASTEEQRARIRAASEAMSAELRDGIRKTISHDLRGPLAIVLGQCEMLLAGLRGDLSEPQQRSVKAIVKHSERLVGMLEELRLAVVRTAPGSEHS
jgi:K+-sensing histidine kinase KdpD